LDPSITAEKESSAILIFNLHAQGM